MKPLLAFTALTALAMSTAHAEAYSDTKLYTQATGDALTLQCDATDPDLGGIGGVCFTLTGDEASASIAIEDVTTLPVGGAYEFVDALGLDQGTVLASGAFCGSVSSVDVPDGAVSLVVYVDGPVFGPQDCVPTSPGIGLRGTITADFT